MINRLNPNSKLFDCRAYWYEQEHNTNCGFAKDASGKKIFDSQVSLVRIVSSNSHMHSIICSHGHASFVTRLHAHNTTPGILL